MGVLSEGSLRYANAGHLPPLLVAGGEARSLDGTALPLGVSGSTQYDEAELALPQGELLFAYTDGLIEARRSGELFGHDRLARLVADTAREHAPADLVQVVHGEIAGWAGGLTDDAVALALQRRQ
jgi:sigma-B regulation protein RsbU (phosphoserine phosphatase)